MSFLKAPIRQPFNGKLMKAAKGSLDAAGKQP
jgi:hypothetical protein